MRTIHSLCTQYTELAPDEIETIVHLSSTLQIIANLEDADMFIDCPASGGDAIVVAEAKPSYVSSSYKKSIVGLLAKSENEPAVARTFRLGIATKQMKAVTQESARVVQSVEPIRNGDRVIGVLIQEKHIDEQRHAIERLNVSNRSYKRISNLVAKVSDENSWLTECIDEALLMVDKNGIVTFCNSLAKNLYRELGFVDEIMGQYYERIRIADETTEGIGERSFLEISVGNRFLSIKHVRIDIPDMSYIVIIKDITNIKEQEKELILKSVAIKEMHHRIKNNLQTVASLLRLQVRRSDNDETKKVLAESMNRILAIATTHELLARSGVDDVNIAEVILNVKNSTNRYHSSGNSNITIRLEGDDFNVESDLATTVALVINELLQNSLEHAFPDGSEGLIRIVVEKGDLYSKIQIIDNGSGFNIRQAENAGREHLGLSIVKSLVTDKLRGNLSLESDENGTNVEFTFINNLMCSDVT